MKRFGLFFLTFLCGYKPVQSEISDRLWLAGAATVPLALLTAVSYKKAQTKLIKLREQNEQTATQKIDDMVAELERDERPAKKPAIVPVRAPHHIAILREMSKDSSYMMCSGGLLACIAVILMTSNNNSGNNADVSWKDVENSNSGLECPTCYNDFASGENVWVCENDKKHIWHAKCPEAGYKAYQEALCIICRHSSIKQCTLGKKTS